MTSFSSILTFSIIQVEVEVQKFAFSPRETDISIFRVAEDAVHDTVQDIRRKLSEGLAHAIQGAERQVENIELKLKANLSPQSPPSDRPQTSQSQDDEEEGWMSDRSNGEAEEVDADIEGERSPSKDSSRRAKSPKPHRSPKLSVVTGRRRQSVRHGVLSPRHTGAHPSPDDTAPSPSTHKTSSTTSRPSSAPHPSLGDDDSNEPRGRRMTHNNARDSSSASSLKSPTFTSSRSLRHSRLESLRSPPGSRDLSPARSVRWADEHSPTVSRPGSAHGRNGATTPRGIRSPPSSIPGTPLAGSDDEGDEPSVTSASAPVTSRSDHAESGGKEKDSPQSTVRFDLPPPPVHGNKP